MRRVGKEGSDLYGQEIEGDIDDDQADNDLSVSCPSAAGATLTLRKGCVALETIHRRRHTISIGARCH